MQETELKCIIDKKTFQKVLSFYPWNKVISQTNHYYRGIDNALKEQGITMRIREIGQKIVLQIKKHLNSDSPLQLCEEIEFKINEIVPFFTEEETQKYTGVKTVANLIGSANTKRHSFMWNENTEICLDYTTYLDTEDYEIEVEFTKDFPSVLLEELKSLGVEFVENSVGKYSRFIKRFKELAKK